MIEPAVAFRINRFISVGAGLDVVGIFLSSDSMIDFGARLNQMVCTINATANCPLQAPFPREDPAYQGLMSIDGNGWGVGGFGGVLITPAPWIRLGVGFHSGAGTINVPVEASVNVPSAITNYVNKNLPSVGLPSLEGEADVSTVSPMTASAGITIDVPPALQLTADFHWRDYSETATMIATVTRSDELDLIGDQVLIKARRDFYWAGLRAAYQIHPRVRLALKLEYEANSRPERYVTPTSIDFHKFAIQAGAAWRVTSWLLMTAEYGHYFMPSRDVNRSFFGPQANPSTPEEQGFDKPSPTGTYSVAADRLAFSATIGF
jgi:long-subunit fatty acid transport protein